jgi:predicted DNA binding protein
MAYESISSHIDKIEELLTQDVSPRKIAEQMGIANQWRTIYRYKKEVFDFKQAASEEWTQEKQKGHEERFEAGKDRIIDDYEFLNRLKLKADILLDFNVGDTYKRVNKDGVEETGIISPHSLSEIYGKAAQIGASAIKAEQELSGDDPESRKASALEELSDAQLRQIIEATTEKEPEPKR